MFGNKSKVPFLFRKRIYTMTPDELGECLKGLKLTLPKEGLTDEFLMEIYERTTKVSSRFKEFGYGMRDLSVDGTHWVDDLNSINYQIKRPTIICLPGNGSTTSEQSNGFCKIIERMLGLNHEQNTEHSSYDMVDIIGAHYGIDRRRDTVGDINDYETEDFVDRFLMPLCVKNGKPLSTEEVCKNMSLITFCSHCYGAVAVDKIINELTKKLVTLGFSKKDIKLIKSHFCHISYSPHIDTYAVPTIRIESMSDSFRQGLAEKYKNTYGKDLNGVAIRYDRDGMYMGQPSKDPESCEILHILSSRLINLEENRDKPIDEHAIEYLGRGDNWKIDERSRNAKNADLMSIMMAYAISWSVSKSIKSHKLQKPQKRRNLDKSLAQELKEIKETYSDKELEM